MNISPQNLIKKLPLKARSHCEIVNANHMEMFTLCNCDIIAPIQPIKTKTSRSRKITQCERVLSVNAQNLIKNTSVK